MRPFECGLCGATFTRQHSLNYHLMTHANQTRFTCPHCNRKFRHPTHFKVNYFYEKYVYITSTKNISYLDENISNYFHDKYYSPQINI